MKNSNFWKTLLTVLYTLFLISVFNTCSDDSTSLDPNPIPTNGIYFTADDAIEMTATIYDFESRIPSSGLDSAFFYVETNDSPNSDISNSVIQDDGSFQIGISKPYNEEFTSHYPRNYTSYHDDSTYVLTFVDSLTFSEDAEFVKYSFGATIYSHNSEGDLSYLSSQVYMVNWNDYNGLPKVGDCYFTLYYFKNPTEIRGFQKIIIDANGISREYITNYDVQVEHGWNIFKGNFISHSGNYFDGEIAVFNVVSEGSPNATWLFNGRELFKNDLHEL
jgi:hypothetical protein